MLTLGMDEAGRGPVIGPMVLAGCLIDEKVAKQFKELGVKDSKLLSQKKREELLEKIKEKSETFEVMIISPDEIDGNSKNKINLNELEAIAYANIINKINKGYKKIKVVIDCPSVNIQKWSDFLKIKIENPQNLEIICEHKADKNHVSVSAASVLAKCIREKEMDRLKEKFGKNIGSGYCSDPATKDFLKKYASEHKDKGIFRKTWITWKIAYESFTQKTLL